MLTRWVSAEQILYLTHPPQRGIKVEKVTWRPSRPDLALMFRSRSPPSPPTQIFVQHGLQS